MKDVDRLIQEVERINTETMSHEGSSPVMRLDEFIVMLKNVCHRLFGPHKGGVI